MSTTVSTHAGISPARLFYCGDDSKMHYALVSFSTHGETRVAMLGFGESVYYTEYQTGSQELDPETALATAQERVLQTITAGVRLAMPKSPFFIISCFEVTAWKTKCEKHPRLQSYNVDGMTIYMMSNNTEKDPTSLAFAKSVYEKFKHQERLINESEIDPEVLAKVKERFGDGSGGSSAGGGNKSGKGSGGEASGTTV